ncbi:MAG: stage III sporulation protein AC [Anaerostipes sp.]|jgi:stage III sporulation protein AC|nr:stage III sporulation protein AC [Anaerostipes sp.]MDD3747014.1 stage III sporulation protein AC [Anaerostipes sp.]MDD4370955.1 stage III sporulation protein AC [Anaerostipes sp.]
MDISIIYRIAAVGILVTVLVQVLKHSGREEQAFLITLAGLILVLTWVIPYIYGLFESVQTLFTIT